MGVLNCAEGDNAANYNSYFHSIPLLRTVYFQHIASFGYIVIGPWAIIYNPADSYKYCFCSCLFFIARWSLLMFFGIFKRPRTQGWLGAASSRLGWGEPCSRCSGDFHPLCDLGSHAWPFSNQNYVSTCHHNQRNLPSRSWTQSWYWIWASFTSAATALVAMSLWSFSKKDALMSRWWWIFLSSWLSFDDYKRMMMIIITWIFQSLTLLSPVDGLDPFGLVPIYCITPGELLNFR